MIVHGGTLSTITNQLKTGCNGGSWNGPGIDSSAIADVQYDTVGVISNGGSATAYYSTFDGQSVSSSDILVQYTYNGDVDLNGQVDGNDYSLLDNGYVNHLAGWLNGDVNYDGVVNGSDYTLIDNTFNNEGSPIVNPGTGVLPAPRNLTASVFSSTEIDLSWIDDASAPDAVNDVIYESTDNGATFNPIDSVASVPAGSTNTYAATGLAPGSSYEFYVTEGGGAAPESSPSNIFTESTPFVAPTLDVEGTGTVVEGQPYQLSLSASYPDGEPGAVTQFSVDWNDGPGGTSNISNYSVTAGVDPTVPLVVTHTFAQGVASPTITVTATDGINGTFGPVTQSVAVIPMTPPPLNYTVASGNEIDLMWGVPSYISTGTILFESTDGVNFNPIYEVAAGVTNYAVTGLNPDTQYWFQAEADSVNGQSAPSTVGPILTDEYMEPLLAVSALGPATENKPLSLSLSWTALQNGLVNDDIISWTVDWGDGNGPQTYQALSSRALLSESNIYSGSTASALVTVDAIDGSNRTFTALSQVFAIAPATPTAVTASYENGGTSVSLNWYDDSQVASDYLVQRELLGSSWTNVDTVTASDGPEYSAVDAGLTAGANGSGGGYLYRVIAQGQQLTDVACPAKSAPSGVIAPFQAVLSSGTTIMVGSGGASSNFGETGGSPSVFEVTVGGVAEVPVSVLDAQVDGEAGVELNVIGYDSATMAPFETTVTTDANGLAYIPIQGIEAGATAIVVTDSGGDEGSGEINVTAPATTNASQYQVSLPNTPITSPNGGTDDIQCNLTASTSAVSADNPQDALVDGISGSLTDLTTGQTIQGFDPRHIYIYPAVGDSAPLVIYDPDLLPIDDTTDLPDPPPPTTVYYDIPIAVTTSSFSLTAKDANQGLGYKHNNDPNAEPTVVATPTVTADLYVGEQPAIDNQKNGRAQAGGTAVLTLSSLNGATWEIQPTSKNGNSEVSATNGNFNGGPVTLTLTPSPDLNNSDPGDLTYTVTATFGQMTAVVTIHILKMDVSTETISEHPDTSVPGSGNVYGPDLSPATQQTSGAYIPWDTLDEDYDGIPDDIEAHGGSWMGSTVAHHPVVGDTLMMRIELQNVAGLTPGSYFLVIPQNVAVYEDYDGSNPVGGSTPFSGVGETTLYVEGISAANFKSPNNILWANWSATGNPRAITVTHADGFKITTFKWSGSQDVPGNTTYTYTASGAANAVGWTTVANGKLSTGANKSLAAITWNNGPAFGEAVYTINDNYSWEFTVNVVQVGLNLNRTNSITLTSDVPGYTTKGTPLTILAQPPASNTPAMQASVSLNAIAGPQVNGTGIMRGARWIEVGFLQTVQITSLTATYQSGNTTASESDKGWADGNTHIDGLPGVAGSIYPWLDTTQSKGLEYLSSTSTYNNAHLLTDNGSQPQVLSTNDSPAIPAAPALRLPSNKALLLSQTQMYLEFELYVAVVTTKLDDPTAVQQAGSGSATDNIYTPLGKQSWYFDGTGNVTTNGEPGRTSWTATAAGTGSIADNGSVLHNTGFLPPTRQLGPATPITIPSGDKGLYAIQRDHGWKLNN